MSDLDRAKIRARNERWLESPDPTVARYAAETLALLDEVERATKAWEGTAEECDRLAARLRVVEQERDEYGLEAMLAGEALHNASEDLAALNAWVSRMPDAGFNSDSPRWDWWHQRPRTSGAGS